MPPVRTVTTGQKVALLVLSPVLFVVLAVYAVAASPFILSGRLSAQPESAKVEPVLSADEASTRKGRYTRNSRGLWLYQRAWLPSSAPVGVVFVVHGLAEHISRNGYEELGRRLTAAGYAVHGMDAIGHGRSSGLRCYLQSWSELWEDELAFIRSFDSTYSKDTPRFLFGHSLGGLISLHVAVRYSQQRSASDWQFSGYVFSAAAAAADPKIATPLNIFLARIAAVLAPKMQIDGIDPVCISRNAAAVQAIRDDPLFYHEGVRARLASEVLNAQRWLKEGGSDGSSPLSLLTAPTLCVHGAADVVVPPACSSFVHERIGSADKELRFYPRGYHEMFEDPDCDLFYNDILAFIKRRTGST